MRQKPMHSKLQRASPDLRTCLAQVHVSRSNLTSYVGLHTSAPPHQLLAGDINKHLQQKTAAEAQQQKLTFSRAFHQGHNHL